MCHQRNYQGHIKVRLINVGNVKNHVGTFTMHGRLVKKQNIYVDTKNSKDETNFFLKVLKDNQLEKTHGSYSLTPSRLLHAQLKRNIGIPQ